jgi:hypothetical protein
VIRYVGLAAVVGVGVLIAYLLSRQGTPEPEAEEPEEAVPPEETAPDPQDAPPPGNENE